MTGRIFTADHQVYDLPPLLAWNVKHTGTVPCDSWSVTAVYKAEMAPVLKLAAGFAAMENGTVQLRGIVDEYEVELGGGGLTVTSRAAADYPDRHGTVVEAVFHLRHIDCLPLGDVAETMVTLIQGHPDTDFRLEHRRPERPPVTLDTRELRAVLEEVPLNSYEVLQWIRDHLREQYAG